MTDDRRRTNRGELKLMDEDTSVKCCRVECEITAIIATKVSNNNKSRYNRSLKLYNFHRGHSEKIIKIKTHFKMV